MMEIGVCMQVAGAVLMVFGAVLTMCKGRIARRLRSMADAFENPYPTMDIEEDTWSAILFWTALMLAMASAFYLGSRFLDLLAKWESVNDWLNKGGAIQFILAMLGMAAVCCLMFVFVESRWRVMCQISAVLAKATGAAERSIKRAPVARMVAIMIFGLVLFALGRIVSHLHGGS